MSLYSARATKFSILFIDNGRTRRPLTPIKYMDKTASTIDSLSSRCPRCAGSCLSVVCAFPEVMVMRCCGLRWEECVQCVIRIVQSLAEQPVIRLFQQLVKIWQIRRTVYSCSACSVAETRRLVGVVGHRSRL